jgi:hypothetical protein
VLSPDTWREFPQDPRRPENAALRASDHERGIVQQALAEAYADGRLDREELDQRTDAAQSARTLGELPALLTDLVPERPARPATAVALTEADDVELQRLAVERYEAQRLHALTGFLTPSLICLAVYLFTGADGFFWPAFVFIGTAMPLLRSLLGRQAMIAEARRELERRQAQELEERSRDD